LICDDGALWRGDPPAALALLMPYEIGPVRAAISMAFCAGCSADCSERELGMAAVVRLRAWIPDLREFHPVAQVGHA
jgi:hypothetical protein